MSFVQDQSAVRRDAESLVCRDSGTAQALCSVSERRRKSLPRTKGGIILVEDAIHFGSDSVMNCRSIVLAKDIDA